MPEPPNRDPNGVVVSTQDQGQGSLRHTALPPRTTSNVSGKPRMQRLRRDGVGNHQVQQKDQEGHHLKPRGWHTGAPARAVSVKSQGPLPGVCSSHGEYGAGRSLQHANLTTNSPPKTLHGSASASLPTWPTSPPSPLRSLLKHYTFLLPLCEALSTHHAVSCLCSCCSLGREHPSPQIPPNSAPSSVSCSFNMCANESSLRPRVPGSLGQK